MNPPPQIPVAVFLTGFTPGGTERQMLELVRRLDRARFRIHVACFHGGGAWRPRVEGSVASIAEFPIRGFARLETAGMLAAFAKWCRRERIAVVQTCDLYANIFGLTGAALARVPVRIGSRRELNPDKTPGQIQLQRHAYRLATKVVANSSAAREMLVREGLATTSIVVIPNGVDAGFFEPRTRASRAGGRSVVTVANLRPEKDHETLIAAAALLSPDFPDLVFHIVGDGPRRGHLEELVRTAGLESRIVFHGHRDDVPALLSQADVFVLPSRSEAFPNSVIEAMAAGLPVVASAVGGLLELVDHGRTGLLVQSGRPEQFADALRALLTDPERAARLGRAARAEALKRYSFERMVQSFEQLYLASLPSRALSSATEAQPAGV